MQLQIVLDEDVTHPLARALRVVGHDVGSAKELGHLGFTDAKLLTRAADLRRLLISHNAKDMRLLHEAWLTWRAQWDALAHPLADHPGILVVPHLPLPDLVRIVEEFAGFGIDLTNRVFSWTELDGWHELFP